MHRVGTKRNDNFYFRYFSDFSNLKAWNEAIMVSFNFSNFFGIFYHVSGWNRTERKDNFNFLSFTALLQRILAWNEATTVFFNFFVIFLEFSITHRVGAKGNHNFYFFSFAAFSCLFSLEMNHNGIF